MDGGRNPVGWAVSYTHLDVYKRQVLEDDSVSKKTLIRRAEAMKLLGSVFKKTFRTKVEQEEAQIFEELVAEATKKKRHT